jgi:hypothetical protein
MLANTFIALFTLAASVAAYNPYLQARGDDSLNHIYSRNLHVRDAQIQDDFDALLRIRDLRASDPELFAIHAKRSLESTGAWAGAVADVAKNGFSIHSKSNVLESSQANKARYCARCRIRLCWWLRS